MLFIIFLISLFVCVAANEYLRQEVISKQVTVTDSNIITTGSRTVTNYVSDTTDCNSADKTFAYGFVLGQCFQDTATSSRIYTSCDKTSGDSNYTAYFDSIDCSGTSASSSLNNGGCGSGFIKVSCEDGTSAQTVYPDASELIDTYDSSSCTGSVVTWYADFNPVTCTESCSPSADVRIDYTYGYSQVTCNDTDTSNAAIAPFGVSVILSTSLIAFNLAFTW